MDTMRIICPCRGAPGERKDVWLHHICSGSALALQRPRLRVKSPALQARLAELQKKLEQHQYNVMLQGIAEKVLCLSSCISIQKPLPCYVKRSRVIIRHCACSDGCRDKEEVMAA